ncbi:MAG TPA: sigma-70 family RNA polymerase sigma factor [Vicinamibacteria bacterium]|nr:sigma-70 family RNA polymerase sigma factor [Vicinamibacteria bacterium]
MDALRTGDEAAFLQLVDRHHASMVRVALLFVPERPVAEEVAQEAWIGVLRGLPRFRGQASLKTWIFRILVNRAKSRGTRDRRARSLREIVSEEAGGTDPAVDPQRFLDAHHPREPRHWAVPPAPWVPSPEAGLLQRELRKRLLGAIEALGPAQRAVITLRDLEGCSAAEACQTLGLTEANQRVLLHRARSRVRRALEDYFRINR